MSLSSSSINILLLNPNSSLAMTKTMESAANTIAASYPSMSISTYTAPEQAPASIDNEDGINASVEAVTNDPGFMSCIRSTPFDAVLVACFSVHPLVKQLAYSLTPVPVIGIFEASILTGLSLIPTAEADGVHKQHKWGIVTTGAFWENHLLNGVAAFLGSSTASSSFSDPRFAGVFSTGLNAGDFHTISQDEINVRLREATKRLLSSGNITCVVMGCGGMGGLQDMIRTIVIEEYGQERAKDVCIVDGVQAGVLQLQQTVLSRRVFGVVE
ncbi:hypothetical protein TGAM01_v206903 [Trichoderma gamsii]|uniref:DCG1 protein n=1 Tax=Trichoderma gamsii TaxID=398673 RepID=A0A2P4ZIX9_9HYPO|nr:hypothetical protein TGAM01_v206903 [Trichoderma gamsii]PON24215.1 hypothetical protein TGAM01_v206903 [Trichoderma gamsii]